jgi:hypothetical protein
LPDLEYVSEDDYCKRVMYLPSELVTIPHPKVGWFTQPILDGLRVPDLLEKNALSVVFGVARVGNVILMDNGVRRLENVEGVQGDCGLFSVSVKVLGALRKGGRDGELSRVKIHVRMSRMVGVKILVHMGNGLRSHDEGERI